MMLSWLLPRPFPVRAGRALRARRRTRLHLETLEARTLLTFNPLQLRQAYGVDQILLYPTRRHGSDGGFAGDGSGQTIAIVDAYRELNIANDLAHFDSVYGLPDPPSFQEAFPQGTPSGNTGWGEEIALDVEYAHAMAPGANILLVEAANNSMSDLYGAVDYARNQPGVSVVSMSWASGEFSGETSYDSYFVTPSGHNGVSFFAASGDSGGVHDYPAMSSNVVSVGGTNLFVDAGGNYSQETAWSSGGGGISSQENEPSYQNGVQSSGKREGPDVSFMAGPVNVYDTYGFSGFMSVSGTSVSTPMWAGIISVVDQQLATWGYDTLNGRTQLLPALYSLATLNNYPYYDGQDFHDIQSGSAGGNQAGLGYDLATGLGSPVANNLVGDLALFATRRIPTRVSLGAPIPISVISVPAPQVRLPDAADPSTSLGTAALGVADSSAPVVLGAAPASPQFLPTSPPLVHSGPDDSVDEGPARMAHHPDTESAFWVLSVSLG
jgi:subtilase family serine protease